MGVISSYKKCPKCGTINTNTDVCINCSELLSYQKKQELREKEMREQQLKDLQEELENPNLIDKMKKHDFFLVRFLGWMLFSVWFVVSAIGAGLAWVIAMVMAG